MNIILLCSVLQRGVHCLHRFKKYVVRKLKVVQGIICLVSIIQSGMVFMPLGTNTSDFDGQCLLYSDIFIQWYVVSSFFCVAGLLVCSCYPCN